MIDMIAIEQWGLEVLGVPKKIRKKRLQESVAAEIENIERSRKVLDHLRSRKRIRFDQKAE
jgi:hypothetical protein